MGRIIALIPVYVGLVQGAVPIRDEALRLRALRSIFPDATLSALPRKAAAEREYSVVGPVQPEEELSAVDLLAEDSDKPVSDRRRTELRLFRSGNQLVAFVTYSFDGANPARCCLAIGKVVLLANQGYRVLSTVSKSPHAFTSFTNVQFVHDYSNGSELVLAGMNGGGAGNVREETVVLSIAEGQLVPLAVFTSALYGDVGTDEVDLIDFKMTLDKRTHFGSNRRLWFIKKSKYPRKVERIPIEVGTEPIEIE